MSGPEAPSRLTAIRIIWAATVVLTVAMVALVRVPTHLGVKVEEANRQARFGQTILDKSGSEYLWRVWWRAGGDFVDVSPGWLLGVALLGGLVTFLVGIFAAYRIALVIPSSTPPRDV